MKISNLISKVGLNPIAKPSPVSLTVLTMTQAETLEQCFALLESVSGRFGLASEHLEY